MTTTNVRLYTTPDCPLCQQAMDILENTPTRLAFKVETVNVNSDPVLTKLYADHIPVADFGNNTRLYWPFSSQDVQNLLGSPDSAAAPADSLSDPAVSGSAREVAVLANKAIGVFARYWLPIIGFFIAIYAILPLLAPVLMSAGYEGPANIIYTAYRLSCHQLPSRSFFVLGHQVAFCQRCTGIYLALLASIPVFFLVRRRLKPLPWPIYVLFLVPLGIDGITQILGLRESSWPLRVITGSMFAIGSAWLALPYLEAGFSDAHSTVETKLKGPKQK